MASRKPPAKRKSRPAVSSGGIWMAFTRLAEAWGPDVAVCGGVPVLMAYAAYKGVSANWGFGTALVGIVAYLILTALRLRHEIALKDAENDALYRAGEKEVRDAMIRHRDEQKAPRSQ